MRRTLVTLALLLALAGVAGAQGPALVIDARATDSGVLVEGEGTEIRATGGELLSLVVTYRPGSDVEVVDELEIGSGVAKWTPRYAGLANLSARIAPAGGGEPVTSDELLSIRFATTLTAGLFVMLGAGLILFGGAFLSIRALLRSEDEE